MEVTVPGRLWGCVHFLYLGAVALEGTASNRAAGAGLGLGARPLPILVPWL